MAASNAQAFPSPGVAQRYYFVIKSLTTGNRLTGGLTGLACNLWKDGANPVSSTNAPAEVGTTGVGYIDLTTSETNYYNVVVEVTATNANAVSDIRPLYTSGVSQVQNGLATSSALSTGITEIESAVSAASVTVAGVWNFADYGDAAGRATTVGGQLAQIWRYLFNQNQVDKNAQTQTLCRDDSVSTLAQGAISANSTTTTKGKLS